MEAGPPAQSPTVDEVDQRLSNALDLCRSIASAASRNPPAQGLPAGATSPRAPTPPGLPSASPRGDGFGRSSSCSVSSAVLGVPDPIRIHKSLCRKVIQRVSHLLPILERLYAESPSVCSDPRAPFVIFRLEEELSDLLSLLTDCSKSYTFSGFLSSRKRTLADRLDACLQEIRQCYTECLILLGGESKRHGAPGEGDDPFRNAEDSIPSSPMVDRSPRTVVGFVGMLNGGRRAFSRSLSDVERDGIVSRSLPPVPQKARPATARVPSSVTCIDPPVWEQQPPKGVQNPAGKPNQERISLGPADVAMASGRPVTPATLPEDEGSVRGLVALLSFGSVAEKLSSLHSLLKISESSDGGKLRVAAAGAIPALSVMLALDNEQMRHAAAGVLLHLAWLDENRIVIAKAGCVPSLVKLLRSGNSENRTLAARVLWNLAINVDNKVIIGATEAVPSLIAIIQSDSEPAAKREAAEALTQLTANNPNNQKLVAEAGAIPSLVGMLREGGPKEQDKAAFALGMLAVNNNENKLTIAGSGAAPLLLDLLESGDATAAKSASWTLYVLSSHLISAAYITACGGVSRVQVALRTGPPEAKYWAGYTLPLLDPGAGLPEKNVTHRYTCLPAAQKDPAESPRQRRGERERMFAL